MKTTLLSGILVLALALSACQNNSDPASPATNDPSNEYTSTLKLLDQLNLTDEQLAFVDEMYYMDEDLSILLDDGQLFTLNQITDGLGDRTTGHRLTDRFGDRDHPFPGRPGPVVDMQALMYFRLIMKACDHTEEEIAAIRGLIAESHKKRAELVRNATDRATLVRELQTEHDALMAAINTLIGQDCIDAVEALKAEIQAKREEMREKMQERRVQAELAFLTRLLDLTEDQTGDVKKLIEDKQAAIKRLREQYKGDPEGLRDAMRRLMTKFDEDLSALLTAEQLRIYNAWKDKKNDRPDPGSRLDQEIERLTKVLELTERQAAQLKELMQKKMEAEKTAIENNRGDRRALAAAMKSIQERFINALQNILTPEQFAKWKRLHHQRGPVHTGPRG